MCDVHIWRKKRPDKSIDCAKEALRVSYIELNMIMIHEDEAGMAFENGLSSEVSGVEMRHFYRSFPMVTIFV